MVQDITHAKLRNTINI